MPVSDTGAMQLFNLRQNRSRIRRLMSCRAAAINANLYPVNNVAVAAAHIA